MSEANAAGRRWGTAQCLAFALAAWVAFAFAFTPLRTSTDEFWHLKTGQWIAQHGLPANDIFTYTAADLPWNNHEWLAELAMWRVWKAAEDQGWGGWRAVILIKSIFIVLAYAGFGLLIGWRLREPAWGALAAALAAALGRRTFYPRPPYITYLFLAVLFWLLIEWRAGRLRGRWLALLAPLFALWANLHGGWMAGLVLIGAFWAEALLDMSLRKPEGLARLKLLTAIGAACVLGSLVNPYGWRLYTLPFHVSKDPYLMASIGEMRPPEWTHVWVLGGVVCLLAAAAIRPSNAPRTIGTLFLVWILWGALFGLSDAAAWFDRSNPPLTTIANYPATLIARFRVSEFHGNYIAGRPLPVPQLALALPVFALAAWRSKLPGWPAHFLLIAFFGYEAIFHVRHLSLLAIVVLPVLAANLDGWSFCAMGERKGIPRLAATWLPLAALLPLSGFWLFNHREGYSYWERDAMLARGIEMQPILKQFPVPIPPFKVSSTTTIPQRGLFLTEPYPATAVNFMLAADLPGPIFNGGNYCGYLIWRLAPEKYKIFTDNRYDIFGGLVIRDEHSILQSWNQYYIDYVRSQDPAEAAKRKTWQEALDFWNMQTLFLPSDATINDSLERDKGWVRVYEDLDWKLWVRDTPENRPSIDRALRMPRPTPWLSIVQLDKNSPATMPGTMGEALKLMPSIPNAERH